MSLDAPRPLTLLICALGGEGGGVLAEWLVDTATRCGYSAQSTSIPGVAQRTGSTTYYFEVFPVPLAGLGNRRPVFSLNPVPGALDLLVSSELLETARQVGNGMTSATRTRVITSSARVLTTAEKMQLADGRASNRDLEGLVRKHSRESKIFDMATIARECGTVSSAVMFGAIAGSGLLPFPRDAYETTIRGAGIGVEASLRGFARAFDIAAQAEPGEKPQSRSDPAAVRPHGPDLSEFPAPVRVMLALGHARMVEYQDDAYAQLYLARMRLILAAEQFAGDGTDFATTRETARFLALWMAFDDIVRVADLKCRASRFARVRSEVRAGDDELVRIYDHFKPGIPEFAALLPESPAQWLLRRDARRRSAGKPPLALPLRVGAHTVTGFLALRFLAGLRRLRRQGSRYAREQRLIDRWLDAIEAGTRAHWALGHEIALCGRLIKGYGSTNDRGRDNLLHVIDHLAVSGSFRGPDARAHAIRSARIAALADDAGKALDQALVEHGAPPRPVRAQPITWIKKPRNTVA